MGPGTVGPPSLYPPLPSPRPSFTLTLLHTLGIPLVRVSSLSLPCILKSCSHQQRYSCSPHFLLDGHTVSFLHLALGAAFPFVS